jgi:hypothetical protein
MASKYPLSSHVKAFGIGIVVAVIGIVAYLQFGGSASSPAISSDELPTVTVYRSPTCQCCEQWVDHLRANGFQVDMQDRNDMQQVKQHYNVPRELASCHTGVVGGYVVEGHVPADEIKRLLAERPGVAGITVPGMPVGSPGMERGNQQDPYNVLTFTQQGEANVFARYNQ